MLSWKSRIEYGERDKVAQKEMRQSGTERNVKSCVTSVRILKKNVKSKAQDC